MSDNAKKGAVVNVAPRIGYQGFYSAGEFWPSGTTPVEVVADDNAKAEAVKAALRAGETRRFVTSAQMEALRAEKQVLSVLTSEQAAAMGGFVLSDEERAAVEKMRKDKAAQQPKK